MRRNGNIEFTKSEKKLVNELIENCFPDDMTQKEISEIMILQKRLNNLQPVMEGTEIIYPTKPAPKPDIMIKPLRLIIRVNGLIHETKRARIKDFDQKLVFEGNGYDVIDVSFEDREDLWK
jgi:hypothetical protein